METCRPIRPIESIHLAVDWMDSLGADAVQDGKTTPSIPGLLNLSTRGRGDVDPLQTSFGLREDENQQQRWWGAQGLGSHSATTTCPADKTDRGTARAETARHCANPLLRSRAVCLCLSYVEVTTTFWALSNHRGGTRFGPTFSYGAGRRICSGLSACVARHTILARKEAYCSG